MLTKMTHGQKFYHQKNLQKHSTEDGLEGYIPGHFKFGRDVILPIKHKVEW